MASPMEKTIGVLPVGSDRGVFTNAHPLWSPPGARGAYGGAFIAQSLVASQQMLPPNFVVHSMHCLFIFAGNSDSPAFYEVETILSSETRVIHMVHVKQKETTVFTTTISFLRSDRSRENGPAHYMASPIPTPPTVPHDEEAWDSERPFQTKWLDLDFDSTSRPEDRNFRSWIRVSPQLSVPDGDPLHSCALAYMSDSLFIGTIARTHSVPRHSTERALERFQALAEKAGSESQVQWLRGLAEQELSDFKTLPAIEEEVGMMVSLSHSIYFHHQESFRADDWILSEMSNPWTGEGRGLVTQRCWSSSGTLIATCVQEGVARLMQEASVSQEAKL